MDSTKAASLPDSELHQLVQELERYRGILETATDAVVTINQNHEIVFLNEAAEKMFGYRRQEVLGGDLGPLLPPEHRPHHRSYVERYARTRQARVIGHRAEVEAEHRDGTRFPISISFSVAEVQGELLFTALMRDLTSQREMARQMRQAEGLAAVGQMVATVSHEIRTPLTLIGGFAKQLARDRGLGARAHKKLTIIAEEVERLEGMLHELNDLSRPQRYQWRELDAGELLDRVRAVMSPQIRRDRFFVKLKKERGLPRIMADRDRLSQVLINLVNNAMQASGPGDEITLRAKRGPREGVVLEVSDYGCGIPPENLDQLFQPFFTTKKRGTGLGLPLARRIVEEHGGTIEVDSAQGRGTTVRLWLPPAPAGGAEAPPGRDELP
jgi:PAS domain S-box-containing protein